MKHKKMSKYSKKFLNDKKGQFLSIGEDVPSLIIVILAIAVLLVSLNSIFTNNLMRNFEMDMYRAAWIMADKASTDWAYVDSSGIAHARLLDKDKICSSCSSLAEYNLSYKVDDLRLKNQICSCGNVSSDTKKVIRLPVAIRYNYTDVHPGSLVVTVGKK